ncbi:PhzF family phenazine biosynthesis protein [Paenibacillus ihumii]|uniref:PhzF family phenazine biosynthesis protein n=1 Tax=Paenibacillus ihumii TaxID=687436 RepID=UPI0006D7B083|nr:PhzF family phenazine biosynthesis protein [Paenibacillus ihumii]
MEFYIVDVFAEQKYQGNPLAVLLPDRELATEEMQQIAKEINFSETTFIMSGKQRDGGYPVRIFTPNAELPFAGHPSLGTAFVIHHQLDPNKSRHMLLNLGVGQIPVSFAEGSDNELWMKQQQPVFGEAIAPAVIAEILQIPVGDIQTAYPIHVSSTGFPSVIVPLKSLDAVRRCEVAPGKYKAFLENIADANLLVFSEETLHEQNDLHVRVFVNDPGYYEDPATGSATGNLAGYLLKHEFLQKGEIQLRIEQGYATGRPSLLHIDASKDGDSYDINVGGRVFFVAKGEWL